jgi:hypothetical protein
MMGAVTRGEFSLPKSAGLIAAAVAAALCLSACGGGGHKSTSSTASNGTSTTTKSGKGKKHPPKKLLVRIRVAGGASAAASVKAKPGQQLVFHALVPNASPSSAQSVTLTFTGGQSKSLTVTASAGGHTTQGTVQSATGKPISFMRLHYTCLAPPAPSFCPGRGATSTGKSQRIEFPSTHTTDVTMAATVGPVNLKVKKVKPLRSTTVPAYSTSELVKLIPKSSGSSAPTQLPLAGSVSAHPGDTILAVARVTGKKRGAAQPITVTINRGPGKSVTVSSKSAGGKSSSATIKSASGSSIALTQPRFTCFLAPFPTFCPPTSMKASSSGYTLTFSAAPGTAAPSVLATVQAG